MESCNPLRRYPLFAVLDPDSVVAWLATGETRALELGETLFQAGTPGRHAYLVQAGRVRVLRDAKGGREVVLGTFGPGELFGEYALLPPGRNMATCRAASPSQVSQLPLEPLRAAVARQPEVQAHLKRWLRLHAIVGHLRDKSFLGFMSATSLLALLDQCETARFPAGHTIQADGLSADCWFAILKGQVRLDLGPAGSRPPALLGPGDCFGEGALLGRPGLSLAEALTETGCMVLRREAFCQRREGSNSLSLQSHISQRSSRPGSYPWVGQQEATDCGVAALAMIARFHGQSISVARLRQRMRVDHRGTSLQEVQQAAASLGFRTTAVRVAAEQLAGIILPAIAHLAGEHFVVLYALGPDSLVVGDPAAGVVTMPVPGFQATWSGNMLLVMR